MILRANCKINLGLDILRRRPDGYHDLETVMFPVRELYDDVEVIPAADLSFQAEGLLIDCPPEANLCLKAYAEMHRRYGVGPVAIRLIKRVPFGAGLGGGSSDATAVLLAVNRLFDLHLSEEKLIEVAASLGSDTAFFVRNTPQYCTGRGEIMTPCSLRLKGLWLVILKPNVAISTREAYAGVTPKVPTEPLSIRITRPVSSWQDEIENAFERSLFLRYPQLAALKKQLLEAGAQYAAMSGSGSALFALFDHAPQLNQLPQGCFLHIEALHETETL